jgi:hypothetical protein
LDVFIGNLPSNIGLETVFNLSKKVGTVLGVVVSESSSFRFHNIYCLKFIMWLLCCDFR